jgi:hypothetical protein
MFLTTISPTVVVSVFLTRAMIILTITLIAEGIMMATYILVTNTGISMVMSGKETAHTNVIEDSAI